MKITKSNIFFYSLIVVALLSPAQFCRIPIGNTFVNWFFSFCVVLLVPYISKRYNPKRNSADYFFVKCFLVWTLIGAIRGAFIAENYWEYKNMISGRTRQTLWSAVQMLTQKLCCQTIHDCPKVVPLHYESE